MVSVKKYLLEDLVKTIWHLKEIFLIFFYTLFEKEFGISNILDKLLLDTQTCYTEIFFWTNKMVSMNDFFIRI